MEFYITDFLVRSLDGVDAQTFPVGQVLSENWRSKR
jgi:hypothetical protein